MNKNKIIYHYNNKKYSLDKKFKVIADSEDQLPDDLKISTITVLIKTNTIFNSAKIGLYLPIDNDIIGTTCRVNGDVITRSSLKKPKEKNSFYNQVTIKLKIPSKDKPINVKLFKKSSIQITGCVAVKNIIDIFEILKNKLSKEIYILKNNNFQQIIFAFDIEKMDIEKIDDIKCGMINSNFYLGLRIDRHRLYHKMHDNKLNVTFEQTIHPSVKIRYQYSPKREITIMVFETGSVIITGGKTKDEIIKSYEFIINFIYENYNDIFKINMVKIIDDCTLGKIDLSKY
jgi:TATA-box binding protein (TBP) (component of TFIID and TFIIIB)